VEATHFRIMIAQLLTLILLRPAVAPTPVNSSGKLVVAASSTRSVQPTEAGPSPNDRG
jgi:hypothetical protein